MTGKFKTPEEELDHLRKLRNIVNGSDVSYQHAESAPDLAAIDQRINHIEKLLAFRVHTRIASDVITEAERQAISNSDDFFSVITARIDAALANINEAERRLADTQRFIDAFDREGK